MIIKYGKAKDANGKWTNYKNGDRFVYALAPVIPALPRSTKINGIPCRIFHDSQDEECKACFQSGHKSGTEDCPAYNNNDNVLSFRSHESVYSNFYACDIPYKDIMFPSLEHAYQWEKAISLGYFGIADEIANAEHAGVARAIANKNIPALESSLWEDKCEQVMTELLEIKAKTHDDFRNALLESGEKILAEATSHRFWATGLDMRKTEMTKSDWWPGKNMLGKLLMTLRNKIKMENEQLTETNETVMIKEMKTEKPRWVMIMNPSLLTLTVQ